jgi:hypothetical protein
MSSVSPLAGGRLFIPVTEARGLLAWNSNF